MIAAVVSDPWLAYVHPIRPAPAQGTTGRGPDRFERAQRDLDAEIDALYLLLAEFRDLMERHPQDVSVRAQFDADFDRLQALEAEQVEQLRQRLDSGLLPRIGEGERLLAEARELLKKHAHPAAPNHTPSAADDPQA